MKGYQISAALFWIGISVYVMVLSLKMEFGTFSSPGPGLMPFLLGMLLMPVSLYILMRSLFGKGREIETEKMKLGEINWTRSCVVLSALLAYAIVLERLGFLIATFLLLSILFRAVGVNRLVNALGAAVITVLVTYFLFNSLNMRFPPGILRSIGL
jgi:putative tricarboxylic transport membrane protein